MTSTAPHTSYVIWYCPRSGSNLLCDLLRFTERAGDPNEHLSSVKALNLLRHYQVSDHAAAQQAIWDAGTRTGVFGMKCQMINPNMRIVTDILRQFPGGKDADGTAELWNTAFPNCRHIALTRRNKVRQAVSWFRATVSKEWTREPGAPGPICDVSDAYDQGAIHHYLLSATMTDAMMADFFTQAGITPHVVVYEDMVADMESTMRRALEFLDIDPAGAPLAPPILERQADGLSEEWVQRFRDDLQNGWQRRW